MHHALKNPHNNLDETPVKSKSSAILKISTLTKGEDIHLNRKTNKGPVGGSKTFFITRSPKLGAFLYISCGTDGSTVYSFLSISRIYQCCLKINSTSLYWAWNPEINPHSLLLLDLGGISGFFFYKHISLERDPTS